MTETTRDVDIRVASDITISVAVAAYLIDLIGLTGKLLMRQNGMALPDMAATIERRLSPSKTSPKN